MQVAIATTATLLVDQLVEASSILPDGRQLARLNVTLDEKTLAALGQICLRLEEADLADGFHLVDGRSQEIDAHCIERDTSAWLAAAVWGEGPHGGFVFSPRIARKP